ncbi:MAG: hypothetical protein A2934_02325 [Candidatus Sungbacteria bacterium RIFCSPLOWO2_01_FULL_47_10]|uniref:Uncharacterized protein n=1 Tax=Candidatus Sungbacteria bacterium RIFCSPLOWO2_01_FULL_47_10 TaxID=1802276 RepID=A0A1G2L651_9BACT|nr:MAG: hypothetical protein A2934_02325 [Candidatus Sungbacteria bacterium RIFCSPLOWO2_01_FULL_47_10]
MKTLLKKMGPNGAGELLRAITFVGDGVGCYETFDVRPDGRRWTDDEHFRFCMEYGMTSGDGALSHGEGFTFHEDGLIIDAAWWWDSDGTLGFRITEDGKEILAITNHDCKLDHEWENAKKLSLGEIRKRYDGFSPSFKTPLLNPNPLFR